jgi:AraC family transcriptional regulator, regulatory protein of adaptative response / methylated-DNA-[protein]-cysteine methyltransferase
MNETNSNLLPNEETCWQAVATRDVRYDGVFYFGVHSTGIYCRPGCPARRPQRDGVSFFASASAARSAGYRACRRCRPDEMLQPREQLVERARRRLDEAEVSPTLAELAGELGASPTHLQRIFKAATGLSPRQYTAARRLERLKDGLQQGQDVTTALYDAGFGSASRLYESARQALGMTPGVYRKGGDGMQIRYACFDTTLGRALLAATGHGICKLSFGDDDAALTADLAIEFPRAECSEDMTGLSAWVEALRAYLEGDRQALDLPLDVLGTQFQQRVWAALRQIPYGQTRTYAQLAEAIGQPAAARAAASACAHNPVAIVTPCHRIIRSDGSLGGYRWGLERKQALLKREHAG